MKKLFSQLIATFIVASATITAAHSQSNLGADCGCPTPVSSRPTVNLSTLAASGGAEDGNLNATNTILDCSKTWILDKKIYVPNGKTLTILPGTVIKGNTGTGSNATALIVSVGGKIFAAGTPTCQIVFTAAADNLDGTYPIANNQQWGGICIAGKATNNLTLAANGPFDASGNGKIAVADGLGTFEGFASSNVKDQFGVDLSTGSFDDDDNSGMLRYVSIRHGGAALSLGGEINSLSLGSVGRGTTIDHVEIVSGGDDGVELWGGTVNLKYISILFGNDDMLDWDDGWKGSAQFLFVLKTDNSASVDSDNGIEADADDQKSNLLPRSHPIIYNATFIGNSKTTTTSDNSGLSAIRAKELTEGEIYNSVFANWKYGFNLTKTISGNRVSVANGGAGEAYDNWKNSGGNGSQSLKVKCNTFTGIINKTFTIDNGSNPSASDSTQFFTTDNNVVLTSVPGANFTFTVNNNTNAVSAKVDATPSPALSTTGCPSYPSTNAFFTPVTYRGAFAPTGDNWLSDWSYAKVLGAVQGAALCPTDLNKDGITNNSDFLLFVAEFNQACD